MSISITESSPTPRDHDRDTTNARICVIRHGYFPEDPRVQREVGGCCGCVALAGARSGDRLQLEASCRPRLVGSQLLGSLPSGRFGQVLPKGLLPGLDSRLFGSRRTAPAEGEAERLMVCRALSSSASRPSARSLKRGQVRPSPARLRLPTTRRW
jgi:hypothetical protein